MINTINKGFLQEGTLQEGVVDYLPRSFKEKFVGLRKDLGLKSYGKIIPRKPDISSLDNHEATASGNNHLFNYHDLLNDSRPRRMSLVGESTILTEGILSSLIQKVIPQKQNFKIETYPAKQKLLDQNRAQQNAIKNKIAVLDMHRDVINRVQPTKAEYDEHLLRFKNSLIRSNHPSNAGGSGVNGVPTQSNPVTSGKIQPRDNSNPYNSYHKQQGYHNQLMIRG